MNPNLFPKRRLAELINQLRRKKDPKCPTINPEDIPDSLVDMVLELGESLAEQEKEGGTQKQKFN